VQFFGTPKKATQTSQMAQAQTPAPTPASAPTKPASRPAPAPASNNNVVSVPNPTSIFPNVLGTETEQTSAAPASAAQSQAAQSLPAPKVPSPSALQKIESAPKTTLTYLFGALLLFLIFALTLTVFIKIQIQHPRVIAGAVATIVLVAGLMYFNMYVTGLRAELPTDMAAAAISAL
jgi:hypothetical protein